MKQINALQWAWICIALILPFSLFAQNDFWTFPGESWSPGLFAPQVLPTDDYTGASADYVHAGIKIRMEKRCSLL